MAAMKSLPHLIWLGLYLAMAGLSLVPHLVTTPNDSDKGLHIIAYCILMIVPAIAIKTLRGRLAVAILLFLTGAAIEVMQWVIGGRLSSVSDALANGGGILLGLLTGYLLRSGYEAVPVQQAESE